MIKADNTCFDEVMGSNVLSSMNVKSARFADACFPSQFVIEESISPYRWIYKDHMDIPENVAGN
jgi:hypothetical protein